MSDFRKKLLAAREKPIAPSEDDLGMGDYFDPWEDVIHGIYGSYSSESDDLMIATLRAAQDRTTFELIKTRGFAAEFALYVLAGHGLIEYGTSPRGGWPDPEIADLWGQLIEKWTAYAAAHWGETPS